MVSCARDEIGVRESTDHNDGARVEAYLANVGLTKGSPWCAAVQAFIYDCCGAKNPRSAYCPDWFRDKDVIYRRDSQKNDFGVCRPGDVFGIWFSEKGRIAHMGMIEEVKWNSIVTLEGNTDPDKSRDGDGFYRVFRPKSQIYAVSNIIKD